MHAEFRRQWASLRRGLATAFVGPIADRVASVRLARTEAEREAIFRFRYRIYVEELGREIGGVDRDRRVVHDAEDDKPYTHLLYCGPLDKLDGTVRIRAWEPGEVPEALYKTFSMGLFPNIHELRTAEVGRFMIAASARGKLIMPAMARSAYLLLGQQARTDLVFSSCRPGLIPLYRRLGSRPYGGALIHDAEGMEVPLVSVMSDEAYYRRNGAPTAPLIRRVFGPSKRAPVDQASFAHLFQDQGDIDQEGLARWEELRGSREASQDQGSEGHFISELSEESLARLARQGIVIDVTPGTLVTREAHHEKEMFVVLRGAFEVRSDEVALAYLGPGDLFGEIGFFRKTGRRSASVAALAQGRLLVLRRKFLHDLARQEPALAMDIMLAIGATLSERLVRKNQQRD